jgi:hypothetical protein
MLGSFVPVPSLKQFEFGNLIAFNGGCRLKVKWSFAIA